MTGPAGSRLKIAFECVFRHIALRQDHYECAVLFLMRGANLNVDNKDGKKPVDLMTTKDASCRTIVR